MQEILKKYFYKGWFVIDIILIYLLIQYIFFYESFIITLVVIKDLFINIFK